MRHLEDRELLVLAFLLIRRRRGRGGPARRWWVRPYLRRRKEQGFYDNLVQELRLDDWPSFTNLHRLNVQEFDQLLRLVRPALEKQWLAREPIDPGAKLSFTLRHLSTGDSYKSLQYAYRISDSTMCSAVLETCAAIYDALHRQFLPSPTQAMFNESMNGFKCVWQFCNCCAAIDGKHVRMFCPHRAGSAYINYKGFHSLILLAIVSYNYILVAYELGAPGRDSDSGVLERSQFGQALRARTLPLPDPQVLPGTNVLMPPVFVGDEAFALLPNLMRPYPGRHGGRLTELEDHFNYRLSRARRVSENFFAILQSRFRIYEGPIIAATPQTVATKVRATLVLHNWLQRKSNIRGHRNVDVNPPQVNNNFLELDSDIIENAEATAIRSTFARFFSSRQGRVQWRWQHY